MKSVSSFSSIDMQWALANIEPSVGNQVGPMSKMTSGQQNCQQNSNVGSTNDCSPS